MSFFNLPYRTVMISRPEGVKLLSSHYFCFPVAFAFTGGHFLCASIQAVVQSRERQLSGKQLPRICASFRRNRTIYSL
jgi:hypothetical protein